MSNNNMKRKRGDSKGSSTEYADGANASDALAFSFVKPCNIVQLVVKEDKTGIWVVHESILRARAPAMMTWLQNLRKCKSTTLQNTFSPPLRVQIGGHCRRVVGLFVHWLYERKILQQVEDNYELTTLAKLWVFGEVMIVPGLQNSAMQSFFRMFRRRNTFAWGPFMKLLKYLQQEFGNFEAGENILWDWVVAAFVWNGGQELVDRQDRFPAVQKVVALTMMKLDNGELLQKKATAPPLANFLVDQKENLLEERDAKKARND